MTTVSDHASLRDQALQQLDQRLPRPRRSPAYFLSLLPVVVVMLTLPLIYIALIGAVGWGMYEWAMISIEQTMASERSMRNWKGWLLIVAAPQFIGLVILFFMVKPLLAPRSKRREPLVADPKQQSFLYAFVGALCDAVGAPRPKRILIDCSANASAGFHQGSVGVTTSERELTIGLVLLRCMSLRQVAGILAHEFGHFSQGISMRLGFLVQSINLWFARVVYDRDAWDDRLATKGDTEISAIGFVLMLARGLVWTTRRILALLMWIGRLASAHLSRQMEHDADQFEVRLAGSSAFCDSMLQIVELGYAEDAAHESLQAAFGDDKVVTDVTAMVKLRHEQMPDDFKQKLVAHLEQETTALFATHPRSMDRMNRAERLNDPGRFELDAPASILIDDFAAVCEMGTENQYRRWTGEGLGSRQKLSPTEIDSGIQAASKARDERRIARGLCVGRFFQDCENSLISIIDPEVSTPEFADADAARVQLESCREAILNDAPAFSTRMHQLADVMNDRIQAKAAAMLCGAGTKIEASEFGLSEASEAAATAKEALLDGEIEKLQGDSRTLIQTITLRLTAIDSVLEAGFATENADSLPRFRHYLHHARVMSEYFDEVNRRSEISMLCVAAFDTGSDEEGKGGKISTLMRPGRAKLAWKAVDWDKDLFERLLRVLATVQYPFASSGQPALLIDTLLPDGPHQPDDSDWVEEALDDLHQGYHQIFMACLTELAEVAETVETELGLPLLPNLPPSPEESDTGLGEKPEEGVP